VIGQLAGLMRLTKVASLDVLGNFVLCNLIVPSLFVKFTYFRNIGKGILVKKTFDRETKHAFGLRAHSVRTNNEDPHSCVAYICCWIILWDT
jgi:hypothetical protein